MIPKNDFPYYQELKEKLSDKYYLTNEQFESMFFENGKIGETKQGPFALCHREAMIDTIKEMVFFSTLMRLNIKETKQGKEREVRIPMNIKGKWYKINEHDLYIRETLEHEEAKKNQKGREKSEGPIGFIILMLAYLKSIGTFNGDYITDSNYALYEGGFIYLNIGTLIGEEYSKYEVGIDDLSTLYNECITIDINQQNTLNTKKVGIFTILPNIDFKIEGIDNLADSKNIIIENGGNYYLPKNGIQGNIKTCLFDIHQYAFKHFYTNDNGEKIVILENPRDTREKLHIPLEKLKELCIFRKTQIDITKLLESILSEHPLPQCLEDTKKGLTSNLAVPNSKK